MMPDYWTSKPLCELVSISKGKKVITSDTCEQNSTPYIGAKAFGGDFTAFTSSTEAVTCEQDDILILWDGERSGLVTTGLHGAVSSTVARLRSKGEVNPHFLYYFIDSKFKWIQERRTGLAVPHVPKDLKDLLIIDLPTPTEQKKIAAILSSVDDAIQATQAVIDQTRRVKRGLLQQLLTRGIGHTRFKQTEMGEIPETWTVATTGQICTSIVPGRDKPKCFNGDIPWLTISDIDGLKVNESKLGLKVTKQELQRVNGKTVPKDAVLMTCVGTFGIVAVAGRELVMNQQLHGFVCGSEVLPLYLCLVLQTKESEMKKISGQTTIPYLNKAKCESICVPLPPINEQNQIVDEIVSIEENINANKKNLDGLSSLKRGLMQDLLTGRVRVKLDGEAAI